MGRTLPDGRSLVVASHVASVLVVRRRAFIVHRSPFANLSEQFCNTALDGLATIGRQHPGHGGC